MEGGGGGIENDCEFSLIFFVKSVLPMVATLFVLLYRVKEGRFKGYYLSMLPFFV